MTDVKVTFLDVKASYRELQPDLDEAYRRVMASGQYVLGSEVEAFEKEFAEYCGVKYCIGVGNGLEALQLILRGLEIGVGDEVIVPSNTFIASWLAVSNVGASPIPVEPSATSFNLDPDCLIPRISSRTKAIMPVHLYGLPAEMDRVVSIGQENGLRIVEDAGQAHGAMYNGRRVGSLGNAAAFSFYPSKNLGCYGDGGAVVTGDEGLAHRIRTLRNYGAETKYLHAFQGQNSRLDPLQAAFLRVKLRRLDEWNRKRQLIAEKYLTGLSSVPQLVLPQVPAWAEHVWHLFVVRHPQRDAFQQHLSNAGVETLIHYPVPPHLSSAYCSKGRISGLSLTEKMADTVLSLPMSPWLEEHQVEHVLQAVASFGNR